MSSEPSLRERKKLETRVAIADAAAALFAEHGFRSVTVDEVAAAAGVSRQTVFNHFPNKEDLVFDRGRELNDGLVQCAAQRAPDIALVEAYRRFNRAFWVRLKNIARDNPQTKFFAIIERSEQLQAYGRQIGNRTVAELAEVLRVEAGVTRDDPRPAVVAAALIAPFYAIFDIVQRRVLGGEDPRDFIDAVLDDADAAFDLLAGGLDGYLPRS